MSPTSPSFAPRKPFVIEIRQDRKKPNGSFIPVSSLKLTEYFRESGLLHSLSPEDLKNLIYLLTFISPEGHCRSSLPILASSMRTASSKVKSRMHRLAGVRWRGEPLIIEVPHKSGIYTYGLHPSVVGYEHLTISETFPEPPMRAAHRDSIIAHSRGLYGRPRAEVEKQILSQLGHDIDETDEQRRLRYRLENVGLSREQAIEVVLTYSEDVIAQQLDWLPYRHAKNPAGYLLSAIEGGYAEPRGVREHRFLVEGELNEDYMIDDDADAVDMPAMLSESQTPPPSTPNTSLEEQQPPSSAITVENLPADGTPINLTPQE